MTLQAAKVEDLAVGQAILWEDNIAEVLAIDHQEGATVLTVKAHYGRRELTVFPWETVHRLLTTDGF